MLREDGHDAGQPNRRLTPSHRRAGLGPDDIDVAQFYDCFTITVLLQIEDYGFCAKGEGGSFVSSGEIDLGRLASRSTPVAGTCPRATSTG